MRTFGVIQLLILTCLALCAWLGVALAQSTDKGVEFLSHASSAFQSGDYTEAATYVEEAMKAGLSKELSARATFIRAQINERNGLYARALQDYSSSLWMDVLSPADRKKAQTGKDRVIAAMGLNSSSPEPHRAMAATAVSPPPSEAPQASSTGVLGMFGGIFGSSSPAEPAPQPAASPAPAQSWQAASASQPVEPKVDAAEPVTAPAYHKATKQAAQASTAQKASLQPASVSTPPGGGFFIFFGNAPSDSAGHAKAREIKHTLADILISRELDVTGADGSYQITAGPYKAKSSALALCSAMKQRGVNCQVTP